MEIGWEVERLGGVQMVDSSNSISFERLLASPAWPLVYELNTNFSVGTFSTTNWKTIHTKKIKRNIKGEKRENIKLP